MNESDKTTPEPLGTPFRKLFGILFYGLAVVVAIPGLYLLPMGLAGAATALFILCMAAFLAFIGWYLTAP